MKKNTEHAFTLIEIMVVVGIIGLLAFGAANINLNTLSDKQKMNISSTRIVSAIETVRNNALLGKGIGTNLDIPKKYKIEFGNTGSGNINIYYSTGVIDNYQVYETNSLNGFSNNALTLKRIQCISPSVPPVTNEIISGTGIIIFEGANLSLTGSCTSSASKTLELDLYRKGFTKTIGINTLNGLISVQD